MLRTMDNVAVFFGLLMLFIFIFSILGMNLFGCKFCNPETGNCERKNFDSLLWATVTVFQVLKYIIYITQNSNEIYLYLDFNTRGLECCLILWNGEDKPLGSIIFHYPYDFWKLCSF